MLGTGVAVGQGYPAFNSISCTGNGSNDVATVSWNLVSGDVDYSLWDYQYPGTTVCVGSEITSCPAYSASPGYHSLQVNGYDPTNNTWYSTSGSMTCPEPPLQPPTFNQVSCSSSDVATVSWNLVSGEINYTLWDYGYPGITVCGGSEITNCPAYTDSPGQHTLQVNGQDPSGNWYSRQTTMTCPQPPVNETIATQPSGLSITVDGSQYNAPYTFSWTPGSQHTIAVNSPQSAYGTQPSLQKFTFANWSDFGAISHTINASASTVTATFATIAAPSQVHVNLSFLSFGYYDKAASYLNNYTTSCPSGLTVGGCMRQVLSNLRQQGVSGVRIFVPLCESDTTISPITNCGQPTANVSFNGTSGSGAAWLQGASEFFADLQSNGIQNVTITIAHASSVGAATVPKSMVTSPAGGGINLCSDTPDPVTFWPGVPYGLKPEAGGAYFPIGQDEPNSRGYNCAPTNPNFIGWTNQFSAINALLGAAKGKVTVNELDFEQELNMVDFTSMLRYIYDNAQSSSYNGSFGCSPTNPPGYVDVVCVVRALMSNNGFDGNRVTWSASYADSTVADSYCPSSSVDPSTGTCNCVDVYTDYSRQFTLGAVSSAFAAGSIGVNKYYVVSSGLYCDNDPHLPGEPLDTSTMLQVPLVPHTLPDIVDTHLRPHIEGAGSGDTHVQQVSTLDFDDLAHFVGLVYPSGPAPQIMLGETHVGTLLVNGTQSDGTQCPSNGYPQYAAASAVAGFNQNQLAGYSGTLVFRPWMELENAQGTCFPYPAYQNVNFSWGGPYAPSEY